MGSWDHDKVLQVCSCQGQAEKNHSQPAGEALPNAAQMLLATFASRTCCWLIFHVLSTRIPEAFSTKLLSSQTLPSLHGWVPKVSSSPRAGFGFCLCSASGEPRSPASPHPPEQQFSHLVYQAPVLFLYHLQICWGCASSHPSFRPIMKTLSSIGPSIDLCSLNIK